ncbi:AraC family transcriptional regulator [Dactylosporangium sp. AC04546]|uniref:helix-turn-helix domain-containing protein n=1 Tax=Dactylosporangium sp. AC04546 TaxID=2862460 RepID=UPI001EE0D6C2|nr:AraC family transcriptional regulator [Dactylosporangium sp. AC04546]WVK79781.1 AraC family transcriptional regulator [Dactylosporangium sp. AC04546]
MGGEHVSWRPAPAVRAFAGAYSGYRQDGPPGEHRGLPSPYITVVVTIDEPLHVSAHPDPRTPPGSYESLVGGLHTVPTMIRHDGRGSGIQIALSPLGARAVLGLPAGELAGADVDGTDVLGGFAAELRERVAAAPTWVDRFRIVDEMLARRVNPAALPAPEVRHAWRRLCAADGPVALSELTREIGWSQRYLSRRFGVEIGLAPKVASRVARFDRARRLLIAHHGAYGLAALAADCGYYDQAHLTREFTALAGLPPARWWAAEFRNVQAAEDLTPADSRV